MFEGLLIEQPRFLVKNHIDDISPSLNKEKKPLKSTNVDMPRHDLSGQCIFLRSEVGNTYETLWVL